MTLNRHYVLLVFIILRCNKLCLIAFALFFNVFLSILKFNVKYYVKVTNLHKLISF